jgi:hypothetical protein
MPNGCRETTPMMPAGIIRHHAMWFLVERLGGNVRPS